MNKTASKKATLRKGKRILLRATRARITQNLGGGFRRHELNPVTIGANTISALELAAPPGRVVISAGWAITDLASAWPTDSFPASVNRWVLLLENPTNFEREVIPFLITKRR